MYFRSSMSSSMPSLDRIVINRIIQPSMNHHSTSRTPPFNHHQCHPIEPSFHPATAAHPSHRTKPQPLGSPSSPAHASLTPWPRWARGCRDLGRWTVVFWGVWHAGRDLHSMLASPVTWAKLQSDGFKLGDTGKPAKESP